jgi:hypothetical protein
VRQHVLRYGTWLVPGTGTWYKYTHSQVVFIVCYDASGTRTNTLHSERPILYVHDTELYVRTDMLSQSVQRILVHRVESICFQ